MKKFLLVVLLLGAATTVADAQCWYCRGNMPMAYPYGPNPYQGYGGGYYGRGGGYPPGFQGRNYPYSSSLPYFVPHNYGGGGGYYQGPRYRFRPDLY